MAVLPAPASTKDIPVPAVKTLSLEREPVADKVKYAASLSKFAWGAEIVICPVEEETMLILVPPTK